MADRSSFLYPRSRYYGKVNPENLVFNANLQEFANRISTICNLETAGKISSEDAYEQIKKLWHDLRNSKKELGVGDNPFSKGNTGDSTS